jgi:hypothetical protein
MSTPTLDSRIAAALAANGKADRDTLAGLVVEAEAALAQARETIDLESERLVDIGNPDPEASDAAIQKAERNLARLDKAVPQLRDRIRQINEATYSRAWHAAADRIESERDKLAVELRELYPNLLERLVDLFGRIDALDAAIGRLHGAAQFGEYRRLVGAEQRARALQSFSAAQPPLRDRLVLPSLAEPSRIAFPPPAPHNPLGTAMVAAAQAVERKSLGLYSPDWAAAEKYAAEQARQESARLAEIEAERQAEAKRKFEQAVLAEDRRARTGG